jgi:hypothetical protein
MASTFASYGLSDSIYPLILGSICHLTLGWIALLIHGPICPLILVSICQLIFYWISPLILGPIYLLILDSWSELPLDP